MPAAGIARGHQEIQLTTIQDSKSKRQRLRRLFLPLAMTCAFVCIWAVFAWVVSSEQAHALEDEVAKNTNLADAHADAKNQELRQLDQTLLALRYEYTRFGKPKSINDYLAALNVDRSVVGVVSLIGPDGTIIASTEPTMKSGFSDRDYFSFHAHAEGDSLFVGTPIKGRFTGRTVISLTRKLTDSKGGFAGIVFIAVNPDFFAADYRDYKLDHGASLAMIGMDGITRVRRLGNNVTYGGSVLASRLFTELKSSTSGSYVGVAASDGVRRAASYRKLEHYPFVMVVASSMSEIDKSLRIRESVYFIVALLLSATVILGGVATAGSRRTKAAAAAIQVKLEGQLRESQKMESIGVLAGGIAHDFNNIITLILGNLKIVREEDRGLSPGGVESLNEIQKAAARARDLVGQILSFGRRTAVHADTVQLDVIVEDAVRILRKTLPSQIEIAFVCLNGTPLVNVDSNQIAQVLLNLGSNAADALDGKPGKITFQLESIPFDDEARKLNAHLDAVKQDHAGPAVQLTVTDTGHGIPDVLLNRIFEPFVTTKPVGKGTGLGLSVVHGIVNAHGGTVWAQRGIDGGAEFVVVLPGLAATDSIEKGVQALTSQGDQPLESPQPDQDALRNLRVLYLDDDESLLFLFKRLLERRGIQVTTSSDADEALNLIKAASDEFDLVISDYNMPLKNGGDFAREVRDINPGIPVSIASGFVDEELQMRAGKVGVRSVLFKAIAVEEFANIVLELVARIQDEKASGNA
jgi:signal transduction histidine kinase/CheY-like chemotaxis protein